MMELYLLMAVFGVIFVLSLVYLARGVARLFAPKQKEEVVCEEHKEELNRVRGREKLLTYAENYRRLAGSYLKQPDETMVEDDPGRMERLFLSKMKENRVVLAGQLNEMAQIITEVAGEIYDVCDNFEKNEDKIKKKLREEGIQTKNVLILEKKQGYKEAYVTVRVGKGKSIEAVHIGKLLSRYLRKTMIPSEECASKVYQEWTTLYFEEDALYKVLTGIAKVAKDGEEVSGDNYSFTKIGPSRMVASLCDGMGSGREACKESENAIELFERYMEAGFTSEAAMQMINSAMVAKSDENMLSSMDVCDINLYDGMCHIMKVGASTTFVKRDKKVDAISSTSLPLGVFHKLDYDTQTIKLYDGDYIFMVSDGVLDQLGDRNNEAIICNIINRMKVTNPKEMAKKLLAKVSHMGNCAGNEKIRDDMTVMVIGIWKK